MDFKGINKRVDDAELADGESPDSANAYYPDDKLQSLGPRRGRSFFNSTAYADSVRGIIPFRVTGMTPEMVLALNDGSLRPVDAPFSYPLMQAPRNFRILTVDSTMQGEVTYPATTDQGGGTIEGIPSAYTVSSGDIILVPRATYGLSSWQESSGTSTVTLTATVRLQTGGGDETLSHSTITLTRENLGSTAGQAAGTPTAAPGDYGSGWVPVTVGVTGRINAVDCLLSASYSNTSSGTFSVSFGTQLILIRGQIT